MLINQTLWDQPSVITRLPLTNQEALKWSMFTLFVFSCFILQSSHPVFLVKPGVALLFSPCYIKHSAWEMAVPFQRDSGKTQAVWCCCISSCCWRGRQSCLSICFLPSELATVHHPSGCLPKGSCSMWAENKHVYGVVFGAVWFHCKQRQHQTQ